MEIRIVYSPGYNIRFGGLEKLHPFDSCKYGRAWDLLSERYGKALKACHITPKNEVSEADLLRVHGRAYLESLKDATVCSRALEMPVLERVPASLTDMCVLRPMRLATQGTILASESALSKGISANLSGGYHHASDHKGEGFCLYADVAIAVAKLRQNGNLKKGKDRILYVDLDAHQGNGVERAFLSDKDVFILDAYNRDIYPNDRIARERIDCPIPLVSGTKDDEYLEAIRTSLTDVLQTKGPFSIAFYNAGTDVYSEDQLGRLALTEEGVLRRDTFVLDSLIAAGIPTVMVLSGGYSQYSYHLVYETVSYLLDTYGFSA